MSGGTGEIKRLLSRYGALDDQLKKLRDQAKPIRAEHKELKERIAELMHTADVDEIEVDGQCFRRVEKEVPVKPKEADQVERASATLGNRKRARQLIKEVNQPLEVKLSTRLTRKCATARTSKTKKPTATPSIKEDDDDDEDAEGDEDE